ncbi:MULTISPECIES: triacylglycerol lipase [Pseudonocardia]|uniref:Alpha/beta hydrolase fold n=1 Tax=Pseudonocardia oroxyli TaxID=366584 RepID=A0A1G7GRX6_PSEOR|nr:MULTISPECIES: alpha/beta fold hydrolase [Pseudonocardia]MCF7553201.1 alpha/beta fold hydrolase [Pseudonocardia sp. WMMC193]SDE90905.1 alpha/beta hydrolase fold [Pseudonocardia oroxyli]
MATVRAGLHRLATAAGGGFSAVSYAARALASPAGVRGIALEWAWLSAHVALYPVGLAGEKIAPRDLYRTDDLDPVQRSLVCADPHTAGTPILLIHGIMDNRSVFTVFRRALRRRGFGLVHAVNYSLFTGDLRSAAREVAEHVARLREATGADRVHIVGHSLGGVIARYYVQCLGGAESVDTLVTLGSPHTGTNTAYLLPTPLARQLRPGSDVMAELAAPAPDCPTRFVVVWSRIDEMIVPQRNARLRHPDLLVEELEVDDVGHLAMPVDPRVVHGVVSRLAHGALPLHLARRLRNRSSTENARSSPA